MHACMHTYIHIYRLFGKVRPEHPLQTYILIQMHTYTQSLPRIAVCTSPQLQIKIASACLGTIFKTMKECWKQSGSSRVKALYVWLLSLLCLALIRSQGNRSTSLVWLAYNKFKWMWMWMCVCMHACDKCWKQLTAKRPTFGGAWLCSLLVWRN